MEDSTLIDPRCFRRPVKALLGILTLALCTGLAHDARACVGPPPEPFCTKALSLAIAGPPTVLLPGGGTFDVPALVVFQLMDIPEGTGICPAGPYAVDVTVTATCDPTGADGSGVLLGSTINPGLNTLSVPVTVPAGPPRMCTLAATASMVLLDGMQLTETAENVVCLAEPAPGNPSLPRLGLSLLGSPGDEIAAVHPGDPATRAFQLVNNDPAESFTGTLGIASRNESRQPGMAGAASPGTGAIAISDPVEGDNFPFEAFLGTPGPVTRGPSVDACIPFTDPLDPDPVVDDFEINLSPNFATTISIVSRPWGMCADGSCGETRLAVEGAFGGGDKGLACTGFVTVVDTSVPPTYACDDSGEVGTVPVPVNPALGALTLGARAFPSITQGILLLLSQLVLRENNFPVATLPSPFAERFNEERGRIQMQYVGDFEVDSFFDIEFDIDIAPDPDGRPLETRLDTLVAADAPTGFERTAPFAEALVQLRDLGDPAFDSFFDLTTQVHLVGIDNLLNRRLIQFENIQFQPKADGSGLRVSLGGGVVTPGEGTDLLAIELAVDLRGFLSPEPQSGIIFTDGFESGNVSRWSTSVP